MGDEAEQGEAGKARAPARAKGSAPRRCVTKPTAPQAPVSAPLHHLAEVEATIERTLDAVPENPTAADPADSQAEDVKMDTVNTAAQGATDTTERAAAAGQAAAADFNGRTQDAMARGAKLVEEMNDFGKGNVEALVESGRIAAKGVETMGQHAAEYARKSLEDATAVMRTLAGTRSPTEFFRLQGDYTRQMFDAMVAETSKSTEAMLKLANDVAQPLSNRFALAAEKVRVAA